MLEAELWLLAELAELDDKLELLLVDTELLDWLDALLGELLDWLLSLWLELLVDCDELLLLWLDWLELLSL